MSINGLKRGDLSVCGLWVFGDVAVAGQRGSGSLPEPPGILGKDPKTLRIRKWGPGVDPGSSLNLE